MYRVRMKWNFFTFISLITGYALCTECPPSDDESVLQAGYRYKYQFKSEALTEAVGTTDERGRITIECNVEVSHSNDCYFNLLLQDCSYSATQGAPHAENTLKKKEKIPELSSYPVQFTMVNGAITSIYHDENDPMYFVNIKRGALSAFVFKLSASSEKNIEMVTDVHGTCPVEIQKIEDGIVKTSTDMLHCAYPSRPDWQLSPWSMFWNMSFIQYVINSTLECEYNINLPEKQLGTLHCKERHAIMLESTHRTTTAVQTNIYYYMTLVEAKKMKKQGKKVDLSKIQAGIVYEYLPTSDPDVTTEPRDFLPVAKEMLAGLVETSTEEIRLSTIPKFTDFVAWVRKAQNLDSLSDTVKDCTFWKSDLPCTDKIKDLSMAYFSDALVQCQTLPCFDAITKLVEKDAFSDLYLNFMLYSWGNMHFTKPEIISYVMKICEAKESRFCWLTLGTLIKKYHQTTFPSTKERSPEVKNVMNLFSDNIGNDCVPSMTFVSKQERNEHMLTFLKALGNTGEAYVKYKARGVLPILKCAQKEDFPMFLRASAVEVLQQMSVCENSISSCHLIHGQLSPLLQNSSVDPNLRIAAYGLLMHGPEIYDFQNELITLFRNENNSQVLSYIAGDLINRLKDVEYIKKFPFFIKLLLQQLERHDMVLEDYQSFEDGKSQSEMHGHFSKLHFLPKELQGFGAKLYSSYIHSFYNRLPQRFGSELVLQLFNKVIDLFGVGGNIEGWQDIGLIMERAIEELDLKLDVMTDEEITNSVNGVLLLLTGGRSEPQQQLKFDPAVLRNIKSIYDTFAKYRSSTLPFFHVYWKMFGSTLSFLTSDDIMGMNYLVEEFQQFLERLSSGVTFNNTRVIRIIEAYHQVPTIMGLPLNWTTDATLAFSLQSGLQLSYQGEESSKPETNAKGYIQPSAALTFLNRMILDFPTYVKFGIQANSSGYTSTQFGGQLNFHDNVKSLKFDAPSKPQKILELFRTNQIIKQDSSEDIAAWDYERTSTDWCSSDETSSAIGVQVCHERSYPDVTNLIKPWALMTGWCVWRLEVLPYDRNLKSYNFYFTDVPSGVHQKEFQLKFDVSGNGKVNRREIMTDIFIDLKTGGGTLKMRVPNLPEFLLSASHSSRYRENKYIGFSDDVTLKLSEKLQYHLLQNYEIRTERRKEESASENVSPKSKRVMIQSIHRDIKLETPFNIYSWVRKSHFQDKGIKADILVTFKNKVPEWNFMSKILPPNFWESESKATVRVLLNWKGLSRKGKDVLVRYLNGEVITPKSNIELTASTLMMFGRYQAAANLTKLELATGKLMSFANFTYDLWNSASGDRNMKEIQVFNLTTPRKSWGFVMKKVIEDSKQQYNMVFTRAAMVPKENALINAEDYIVWWSENLKHHFELNQVDFVLSADIEDRYPENSELLAEFENLKESDIRGLFTLFRLADVQFFYPFGSKQENVKFNGKFLFSKDPVIFRFQKDFTLSSSYNNLQLTSHSVYRSEEGKSRDLAHNSYFTHTTSDTQAFYNMDFNQGVSKNGCHQIHFNHNITSHVYNMASNVNYFCHSDDPKLHTLTLNLDSHSRYWQMLDMKIRQIIKDITPELTEESMNFTNPNMFINVNAEWQGKEHKKIAIFNQVGMQHPVMKLIIHATKPSAYLFEIVLPQGEREIKMLYHRQSSSDYKKLKAYFFFPDNTHPVFYVHGNILKSEHRVWKLELYPGLSHFIQFISNSVSGAISSVEAIAEDEYHPLNKMLAPALKMPLAQYLSEVGNDIKQSGHWLFANLNEAIASLRPFYESSVTIITNLYSALKHHLSEIYSIIEEKSLTVWAIKYFEVGQLLQEKWENMPSLTSLFCEWIFASNRERNSKDHPMKVLTFHTGNLVKWKSFDQAPSLNMDYINQLFPVLIDRSSHVIKPFHLQEKESKLAMIFGPRHVYTFDGQLYEFPAYPSENCSFLLSHDIYGSKFSVVVTAEYINILFPEVAISINSKDEVFIDGSNSATSLPFQTASKTIRVRREANIVVVMSPVLNVLCEGQSFLCTLELSGWNGGGTIGLLGNADGEIHNEFMLPDGRVTSDVVEFAQSYELSGRSRCKDLKVAKKSLSSKQHEVQCAEHLQNVCSFYDHLQESFSDPCVTYLKEEENLCYTESALAALCYHKRQPMKTECNVRKQEKSQTRHRLEIVLIVNQHQGMLGEKDVRKGIGSIVDAVQQKFSSQGYSTIHFSLIGFGGVGVRYSPSVHAIGSNIWFSHKEAISDLLPTLEFEGTESFSPVDALQYAAEALGHDTFDSKVFIIITDSDKLDSSKKSLHLVRSYLDINYITLYTIANYPSIDKGKKVFGVRADGLIFPTSKKGEDFLDYPRGDLAKLTSGTRGSLFLKKFVDSNDPSSYFSEFAEEVWAKLQKEMGYCRSCKVVHSGWWYYQNECHLTSCKA